MKPAHARVAGAATVRRSRISNPALLVGLLAAALLLTPSAKAAEWSGPSEISNSTSRGADQLVIDANALGDFVAAWRLNPADDIAALTKAFNGSPAAPRKYTGDYEDPDVAIGGGSVGVLAFEDGSSNTSVYAASKATGASSFTGATPFSGDGVGSPYNDPPSAQQPSVAVNGAGVGMLMFARDYYFPPNYTGIAEAIEGRILTNPATNTWNSGADLNLDVNDPRGREVSVGRDGSAFLGINHFEQGPCWGLDTAVLEQNGTGSSNPDSFALKCAGAKYNGSYPSNDRLPSNDIVMAYRHHVDSSVNFLDLSKARALAGSSNLEASEVRLDEAGGSQTTSGRVLVRTDAAGNALVAWHDSDSAGSGNQESMLARYRPNGGSWGPAETISSGENYSGDLDLDVDNAGSGYIVYKRTNPSSGNQEIVAAQRSPGSGGSWTTPELLSDNQSAVSQPQVEAGRNSQAYASWVANTNDGVFYAENKAPQCGDGIDNDGDGKIDHPADPGCSSAADDDEVDSGDKPGGPGNDSSAPVGSAKKKGKAKAGKTIKLKVSSNEDGTAKASGMQKQTSRAKKKRQAGIAVVEIAKKKIKVKLKTARTKLEANVTTVLKLKPKGKKNRKRASKLRKQVKKGAKAKANLTVEFADLAGNSSRKKLSLKLK